MKRGDPAQIRTMTFRPELQPTSLICSVILWSCGNMIFSTEMSYLCFTHLSNMDIQYFTDLLSELLLRQTVGHVDAAQQAAGGVLFRKLGLCTEKENGYRSNNTQTYRQDIRWGGDSFQEVCISITVLAVKHLQASVMFTSLVDVAVHGLHLSTLLRGGLLGCSSDPKTTPVGCVPCSALYPTHTHTNAKFPLFTH